VGSVASLDIIAHVFLSLSGVLCELTKEGFMNYKNLLFVICFLSTGVFAAGNYASVELTHLNPTFAESTWLREKQFMPRYPVELAMKGIAGCGIFKVIVDESGSTESIDLISSVPKKVISRPVTKVIKDWDWTLADGKPPIREEKLLKLDFCMGGSTEEESISKCKQQATMACE
tara:strand:+ start:27 stop:548 length:522 start_codon:yes stop_codon:yes gene_type:complete